MPQEVNRTDSTPSNTNAQESRSVQDSKSSRNSDQKVDTMSSSGKMSSDSFRTGSISTMSSTQALIEQQRRSSVGKIIDKARAKMTGSERIPNDEADFERSKAKEAEKQRRQEEYERLKLNDRTKFGMPGGAGQWSA